MNRHEYIADIKEKLKGLSEEDINKAIEYYEEAIDDRLEDGLTEDQAINSIGTPDEIAEKILMDCPLTKLVAAKTKPKRKLKGWEIALLIVFSPVWITLALLALIMALVVVILFFTLIACIVIIILSFILGGIVGIAACLQELFATSHFDLMQFGMALMLLGLGTVLLIPTKNLVVLLFEKIGSFFKWIKRKIVNR